MQNSLQIFIVLVLFSFSHTSFECYSARTFTSPLHILHLILNPKEKCCSREVFKQNTNKHFHIHDPLKNPTGEKFCCKTFSNLLNGALWKVAFELQNFFFIMELEWITRIKFSSDFLWTWKVQKFSLESNSLSFKWKLFLIAFQSLSKVFWEMRKFFGGFLKVCLNHVSAISFQFWCEKKYSDSN